MTFPLLNHALSCVAVTHVMHGKCVFRSGPFERADGAMSRSAGQWSEAGRHVCIGRHGFGTGGAGRGHLSAGPVVSAMCGTGLPLRLAMSGAARGDRGTSEPARRFSDRLDVDVLALSAPAVVVPGGTPSPRAAGCRVVVFLRRWWRSPVCRAARVHERRTTGGRGNRRCLRRSKCHGPRGDRRAAVSRGTREAGGGHRCPRVSRDGHGCPGRVPRCAVPRRQRVHRSSLRVPMGALTARERADAVPPGVSRDVRRRAGGGSGYTWESPVQVSAWVAYGHTRNGLVASRAAAPRHTGRAAALTRTAGTMALLAEPILSRRRCVRSGGPVVAGARTVRVRKETNSLSRNGRTSPVKLSPRSPWWTAWGAGVGRRPPAPFRLSRRRGLPGPRR